MTEWRIQTNDLQSINDASKQDMYQVFDTMYPVQDSTFMQGWCKDSIMYECLGARTGMNNASSRADQAKRALTKANDDRVDTVTEIGQQQDYDRVATFRGWSDLADYWTNRLDAWSNRFELIYGETWEQALDNKNKSKATPSKLRQPTDEEHEEYADKILNADINTLVGQGV